MRILVINPIPYTSETRNIKKANSIKDTMIYDLCISFLEHGDEVTLFMAEPFCPYEKESYPFPVVWGKCLFPKVFAPHRFPVMYELAGYLWKTQTKFDMIISSEVFSFNSLLAYWLAPKKLIIWHELAKHNALWKQVPSQIWYGFIAPVFMRNAKIVPRSQAAQGFIRQYCDNVTDLIIDHGVNLEKFHGCWEKDNYYVVCSQLIDRKRIDGIIIAFSNYLNKYDHTCKLYIIGDGDARDKLIELSESLKITDYVLFTGKLEHASLMPILSKAKALLVNTEKDNSMISIVESIAAGTPVLTTKVPLNAVYIEEYKLGIARQSWDEQDMWEIARNNEEYVRNCMKYREELSTKKNVERFYEAFE